MKIINQTETSAILAGLRLLQRYGYPKEYETLRELDKEQIDELCEAINCDKFASFPVATDSMTVWAVVSDTDEGTRADLYGDEDAAHKGYIDLAMSYDQVKENLISDTPTYEEVSEVWEEVISSGDGGIIDTITLTCEEVKVFIPVNVLYKNVIGFVNFYKCPNCSDTAWSDEADSMCNYRCPTCNKEIEPYCSEEVFDEDSAPKTYPLVLEMEAASIAPDVLSILEGVIELTPSDPESFMWLVRVKTLIDTLDDSGLEDDYTDAFKDQWSEFVKQVQKTGAKYLLVKGGQTV